MIPILIENRTYWASSPAILSCSAWFAEVSVGRLWDQGVEAPDGREVRWADVRFSEVEDKATVSRLKSMLEMDDGAVEGTAFIEVLMRELFETREEAVADYKAKARSMIDGLRSKCSEMERWMEGLK